MNPTEAENERLAAALEWKNVGQMRELAEAMRRAEAAEKERDEARALYESQREYADVQYRNWIAAEAREKALLAEREAERKAWAGIEQKASGLLHRLDALKDAARRTDHGDHHYDIDVQRMDCWLCAAIEDRYQPEWMDEPYECLNDPIVRRLRMQTKPPAASSPEGGS